LSRAPAGEIGMSRPAVMEDDQEEYSEAEEEMEKKEEADYSDDEEFWNNTFLHNIKPTEAVTTW